MLTVLVRHALAYVIVSRPRSVMRNQDVRRVYSNGMFPSVDRFKQLPSRNGLYIELGSVIALRSLRTRVSGNYAVSRWLVPAVGLLNRY